MRGLTLAKHRAKHRLIILGSSGRDKQWQTPALLYPLLMRNGQSTASTLDLSPRSGPLRKGGSCWLCKRGSGWLRKGSSGWCPEDGRIQGQTEGKENYLDPRRSICCRCSDMKTTIRKGKSCKETTKTQLCCSIATHILHNISAATIVYDVDRLNTPASTALVWLLYR